MIWWTYPIMLIFGMARQGFCAADSPLKNVSVTVTLQPPESSNQLILHGLAYHASGSFIPSKNKACAVRAAEKAWEGKAEEDAVIWGTSPRQPMFKSRMGSPGRCLLTLYFLWLALSVHCTTLGSGSYFKACTHPWGKSGSHILEELGLIIIY